MNRRDFLRSLGVLALAPSSCARLPTSGGVIVNDVHSRLNATRVDAVLLPHSVEDVQRMVRRSDVLSIAGGRHAMGGQQFCADAELLDTTRLDRVLHLDADAGTVDVEAGIQWPALVDYLVNKQQGAPRAWSIIQKQTGADRLCIGGAIAANIHGRGLRMRPFVDDVVSFTLVNADGRLVTCSREENAELFRLVVGGYGLFGVVYSAQLRLQPRHKVRRTVDIQVIEDVMAAFEQRIADGYEYGDFQYSIDPASDGFMRRGVFSCYKPVDAATPIDEGQKQLTDKDWRDLLYLAHKEPSRVYPIYTRYYLSTNGQVYWSDEHQLSIYPDNYHDAIGPGSEMITEICVPRDRLVDFMAEAAVHIRRGNVPVIYGTIRLILKDDESFLAWARQDYACVIFNLHVAPDRMAEAADAFRALIDMAIRRDGSYYLTYHRWATREQLLSCYPQFPEFLRLKRKYDPGERFQSDWYRHGKKLLGA